MSTLKTIIPKPERTQSTLLAQPRKKASDEARQRGLMVGSLCLLLLALSIVLWHDRDFWFPDSTDAESDQVESPPVAKAAPAAEPAATAKTLSPTKSARKITHPTVKATAPSTTPPAPAPAPPAVAPTSRTVLPPLEVEVVAGDPHSTIRPGS